LVLVVHFTTNRADGCEKLVTQIGVSRLGKLKSGLNDFFQIVWSLRREPIRDDLLCQLPVKYQEIDDVWESAN